MRKPKRLTGTRWWWSVLGVCAAGTVLAVGGVEVPGVGGGEASPVKLPADDASAIVDGVAAFVNGEAITIAEVMAGVRSFLGDSDWVGGRGRQEAFRAAYAEALGQLVNQRLIVQSYRAGEARLPDWLIEKRMAELLDTRFDGDRGALMHELSMQRLTFDDWRTRIEEQMIVAAMRQSQVDAHLQVSPAQVLAHYRTNTSNYVQKAATEVGLILLKPGENEAAEALAVRSQAVLTRLAAGERFDAVAREVSDDASRDRGGQWGWIVPEEMLRDELCAALKALPVGGRQAVPTSTGTYILQKMGERPSGRRSIEDVRPEIERFLTAAESQRLFLAWMMRLRSDAHIQTYDVF